MTSPRFPIGIQTLSEIREGDYIYVDDSSAAEALKQIAEKGYMLPYACDNRKLVINFDSV